MEVYNDLNDSIVNVFRVLRDKEKAEELQRRLLYTPYSRSEFYAAYTNNGGDDDIERARKVIVRSQMAVGSAGATRKSRAGFLSLVSQDVGGSYNKYRNSLENFVRRLECVVIENIDAIRLIGLYDHESTLFYCDPPYMPDTWNRNDGNHVYADFSYREQDHENLCKKLNEIKGVAVVSGYDNDLYNDLLHGWRKESIQTTNQRAETRTEVIWISPNCTEPEKPTKTLEEFM